MISKFCVLVTVPPLRWRTFPKTLTSNRASMAVQSKTDPNFAFRDWGLPILPKRDRK